MEGVEIAIGGMALLAVHGAGLEGVACVRVNARNRWLANWWAS